VRAVLAAVPAASDEQAQQGAACYGCGKPYDDFFDLFVPDAVWAVINPTQPVREGGGLLCPNCIHTACEVAGLRNVPAAFSSVLKSVPYEDRSEGEDGMAWLNAQWEVQQGQTQEVQR
jgi:hypothetical protein